MQFVNVGTLRLVCCALWAAWRLALSSRSVQAQYRFDHWTTDNGLPQNTVRDIVQTRDGYLWLATFDGLVRFDGVRFTVFNKNNTSGLVNNRFTQLYEDRHGVLWASTEENGVVRFAQGRFASFTTANGLSSNIVHGVGGDTQGEVLVVQGDRWSRWADGKFLPAEEVQFALPDAGSGRRLCWTPALVRAAAPWPRQVAGLTQDQRGDVWFTNQWCQ